MPFLLFDALQDGASVVVVGRRTSPELEALAALPGARLQVITGIDVADHVGLTTKMVPAITEPLDIVINNVCVQYALCQLPLPLATTWILPPR